MPDPQRREMRRTHLDASVVPVERALLARAAVLEAEYKQLIQETHLPMGEVALASGFGSVRRFNETFQQLFGRPPGALRCSRQEEVSFNSDADRR